MTKKQNTEAEVVKAMVEQLTETEPKTDMNVNTMTEAEEANQADQEVEETFSPYKATDFVNAYLKEVGLKDKDGNDKRLPAQMLYRYVQDGRIEAQKNAANKWEITLTALTDWLLAYTTKQLALQAKKAEAVGEETKASEKPATEEVNEFEEV